MTINNYIHLSWRITSKFAYSTLILFLFSCKPNFDKLPIAKFPKPKTTFSDVLISIKNNMVQINNSNVMNLNDAVDQDSLLLGPLFERIDDICTPKDLTKIDISDLDTTFKVCEEELDINLPFTANFDLVTKIIASGRTAGYYEFNFLTLFQISKNKSSVTTQLGEFEINFPFEKIHKKYSRGHGTNLNLAVVLQGDSILLFLGGGSLPPIHYKTDHFSSANDSRETYLFLPRNNKAKSKEPLRVVADSLGNPILDSTLNWMTNKPKPGEKYRLIGAQKQYIVSNNFKERSAFVNLSAFQELARNIWRIREHVLKLKGRFIPADIKKATILSKKEVGYEKIVKTFDVSYHTGFTDIDIKLINDVTPPWLIEF